MALETQGHALSKIALLVDEGKIKPITTQCLDLTIEGLRRAHECKQLVLLSILMMYFNVVMESGETVGKVVLTVLAQGAFQ